MDSTLFVIIALLILSIIWFIIKHKKDLRKDQQIFNEYLENQRKQSLTEEVEVIGTQKKDSELLN